MGYGIQIPANQLGKSSELWDLAGYGILQAWLMTGSTVVMILTLYRDRAYEAVMIMYLIILNLLMVTLRVTLCGSNIGPVHWYYIIL